MKRRFNLREYILEKLGLDEDEDEFEVELGVQLETGENAESITEVLKRAPIKRADINILDYRDREMYVRDKCEQMKSAAEEIEEQKTEYQKVTEQLADLDELGSLPTMSFNELVRLANVIEKIEEDEDNYVRPLSKITETQFREMERLEPEINNIIRAIRKEEDHQMTVKRDLNLLEGEKGALAYQRKEEKAKAANAKAFAVICVFLSVMASCLLLALQLTLGFNVRTGYYVILAFLSFSLMGVVVTYKNALDEQTKAEKKINRAISLQNSVKIKYVNSTNLLDYYYSKYNINNSYELSYMWEKYIEEKAARSHSEDVAQKMENARKVLANELRKYRLNDVSVFVYKPYLITDDDEFDELRRNLIIQRQKLKKGIDFNSFSLEASKKDIEDIVREYPKFSKEILAIVSQYEE